MTIANRPQLYTGLFAFIAGGLLYFFMRPPGATYFQQKFVWIDRIIPRIPDFPALINGSFFEFIHPFSFSLIGMGLISKTRRSRLFVCSIFMLLNLFCEFGQRYKSMVMQIIPDWFDSLPLLVNTNNYFSYGTFDWLDVAAIVLGSSMAFLMTEFYAWRMTNE